MGKALEFDKSLFERLYTGPSFENLRRTMLEVRFVNLMHATIIDPASPGPVQILGSYQHFPLPRIL